MQTYLFHINTITFGKEFICNECIAMFTENIFGKVEFDLKKRRQIWEASDTWDVRSPDTISCSAFLEYYAPSTTWDDMLKVLETQDTNLAGVFADVKKQVARSFIHESFYKFMEANETNRIILRGEDKSIEETILYIEEDKNVQFHRAIIYYGINEITFWVCDKQWKCQKALRQPQAIKKWLETSRLIAIQDDFSWTRKNREIIPRAMIVLPITTNACVLNTDQFAEQSLYLMIENTELVTVNPIVACLEPNFFNLVIESSKTGETSKTSEAQREEEVQVSKTTAKTVTNNKNPYNLSQTEFLSITLLCLVVFMYCI